MNMGKKVILCLMNRAVIKEHSLLLQLVASKSTLEQ